MHLLSNYVWVNKAQKMLQNDNENLSNIVKMII